MKKWNGSRVEAEGQMARSKRGASPSRNGGITSKRRSQLPFCLAPSRVALILAPKAFGVARLAEIAADIGTTFAPWPIPQTRDDPLQYFNSLLKDWVDADCRDLE